MLITNFSSSTDPHTRFTLSTPEFHSSCTALHLRPQIIKTLANDSLLRFSEMQTAIASLIPLLTIISQGSVARTDLSSSSTPTTHTQISRTPDVPGPASESNIAIESVDASLSIPALVSNPHSHAMLSPLYLISLLHQSVWYPSLSQKLLSFFALKLVIKLPPALASSLRESDESCSSLRPPEYITNPPTTRSSHGTPAPPESQFYLIDDNHLTYSSILTHPLELLREKAPVSINLLASSHPDALCFFLQSLLVRLPNQKTPSASSSILSSKQMLALSPTATLSVSSHVTALLLMKHNPGVVGPLHLSNGI